MEIFWKGCKDWSSQDKCPVSHRHTTESRHWQTERLYGKEKRRRVEEGYDSANDKKEDP